MLIDEATIVRIEKQWEQGLTSAQILALLGSVGVSLTEATLRKYVQLGLLPRSVRVGQKGKHRGSRGLYPARVLRRVLLIKSMMGQGFTIEQIQREFLFLSSELEQLEDSLADIFRKLGESGGSAQRAASSGPIRLFERELSDVEGMGQELLERLRKLVGRIKGEQDAEVGEIRLSTLGQVAS